jgi:hypothetical protein
MGGPFLVGQGLGGLQAGCAVPDVRYHAAYAVLAGMFGAHFMDLGSGCGWLRQAVPVHPALLCWALLGRPPSPSLHRLWGSP